MLTRHSTELTDPGWSHHWRTGGPITLAELTSRWSHATGGRHPCSNTTLPPKVAPTATSAATTMEMTRIGTVGWVWEW